MQENKKRIAIAGIHTGIGKTIVSTIVADALEADYWKPVQAGIEERDTLVVAQLLNNGHERVFQEAFLLTQPMSPHAAAAIDGVAIDFRRFTWPETSNTLVVETAGGLLSPIAARETAADFISYYQLPVILVSQNYLGSINHTLLAIEVLKSRGIRLLGIIFSGDENPSSEAFIRQYSGAPVIARIPFLDPVSKETVAACWREIRDSLLNVIN